ncbi:MULTISPECIES: Pycsar system effector family protein [Streptomyces]|uniref:Pycsar system effector family protein n=1 Tax=Streptomyces TaxID=1883 RepID=UPI0008238A9D|nr:MULTISPECIES: Pycsar system effector family protein [Streptomyces]SCK62902.1 hypothetical protein YUWDRAFT_06698 [Streptomyces sp. AmelKG-D3]
MTIPGGDADPDLDVDTETDHGTGLARVLLSEVREELVKADNKAGLMLASVGGALIALLGAIGSGGIPLRQYDLVPQLLIWAGCAACVPTLVLLGLAVTPRLGSPHYSRTHYFGDARLARSVARLEHTIRRTDLVSRDLHQLAILSQIVWTKYRCIRHAFGWGAAFLTLTLLGIVIGASS